MMSRSEEPNQEELFQEAAAWIASVEARKVSGGPKTDAGKRISSRNSRKHGLMSKDIETRFDRGLDIPAWLFTIADQLRSMADDNDSIDAHLVRKALIAAWRAVLAQNLLDLEMASSADCAADEELNFYTKKAKKMSYYTSIFRAERDNAIRRLNRRHLDQKNANC